MNNILLDPLPDEWHGYKVNTWFQVGVQIYIIKYDNALANWERTQLILELLFDDYDGELREHPVGKELDECISWFLNGWYHDRPGKDKGQLRSMDFDIDQYRIYADFMQIYHIDLSDSEMHFWKFMGLLWNMPYKYSSFLQAVNIRTREIKANMSAEEKRAIADAQAVYALDQPEKKKEYTKEQIKSIDSYDAKMAKARAKKG